MLPAVRRARGRRPAPVHLPLRIVREAFSRPDAGRGATLDFDAVAAPRPLLPRPAAADAEALTRLRESLAWFWNSNAEWAGEQVAVSEGYPPLVRELVRAFGVESGDAVVLSGSEPDARRSAWRAALPEGVRLVEWRPKPHGHLDLSDLDGLVDRRTRLVVQTKACPVTGALNEVIPVAQRLEGTGVGVVAEASHFIAHGPLDLRNLRCDAAIASLDELFGARGAALWLRQPPTGGVAASISPPAIAALGRVLAYVERLGSDAGAPVAPPSERFGRREAMRRGMQGIRQEGRILSRRMLRALARLPRVRVLGEPEETRAALRLPTFTFTARGIPAAELEAALREAGIEVGGGSLGSARTLAGLGADPEAGAVRASLAHYHTAADIGRFAKTLEAALA